ncbi:MAG: hypothetical protein LBR17_08460 [Bacteroidales bacterium]|jgi:hypothetical protein|nr:hypothetical protein [Bacteroidales bacterium]
MSYNPQHGIPYINGKLYEWAKIICSIAGVTITGISAINYSETEETTNVFGAGKYPIGRRKGQITTEASITLYKDEITRLEDAAPFGRLQDYAPFDIEVHFAEDVVSKQRTDILKNCSFTNNNLSAATDNNIDAVELTLVCSHIEFGVK